MFATRRDDRGVAMIMTVVIILVAASLAAVILIQGTNTDRHSGRGKNWNEALQAADAGVQAAIARLQADNGVVPASQPVTGTTADGTYSFTVQRLPRGRYQIDSTGTSGTVDGLRREREIRATLAPPVSFEYALFSLSDVETKNVNHVAGDIWANGSVTVYNNDTVDGDVFAANGYLRMQANAEITGDVHTGSIDGDGVAMYVETVGGNVKASSSLVGCGGGPAHNDYDIVGISPVATGSIGGNALTYGHTIDANVGGTQTTGECTAAPQTKPMPFFNFDPTVYDPAPNEFLSVASFQAYLAGNSDLEGVFHIVGDGMIDLNGVTIVGDTTIIADTARIWTNGVDADTGGEDTLFVLVSGYVPQPGDTCVSDDSASGNPEDCAIGIKNNFDPNDMDVATLVYAPYGPVAFKNTSEFKGAVYGKNIVMKNNLEITYDGRVDRVLGFGPVTYEVESWLEP